MIKNCLLDVIQIRCTFDFLNLCLVVMTNDFVGSEGLLSECDKAMFDGLLELEEE